MQWYPAVYLLCSGPSSVPAVQWYLLGRLTAAGEAANYLSTALPQCTAVMLLGHAIQRASSWVSLPQRSLPWRCLAGAMWLRASWLLASTVPRQADDAYWPLGHRVQVIRYDILYDIDSGRIKNVQRST